MRTLETRLYTNVALTAIILLLAALVVSPYVSLPSAHAQSTRDANDRASRAANLDPAQALTAEATEKVAEANREIAEAMRKSADAQEDIAKAIEKLSRNVVIPN